MRLNKEKKGWDDELESPRKQARHFQRPAPHTATPTSKKTKRRAREQKSKAAEKTRRNEANHLANLEAKQRIERQKKDEKQKKNSQELSEGKKKRGDGLKKEATVFQLRQRRRGIRQMNPRRKFQRTIKAQSPPTISEKSCRLPTARDKMPPSPLKSPSPNKLTKRCCVSPRGGTRRKRCLAQEGTFKEEGIRFKDEIAGLNNGRSQTLVR